MIDYSLPTTLNIAGKDLAIRYDYRAILDCMEILRADDLDERERTIAFLEVFYENAEEIEDLNEAIKKAIAFISNGTDDNDTHREYMRWDHDFKFIVSPVNKVLGTEIRSLPELHWWTFLGAFREIGECYFQNIVSIRHKKMKHQKLEKWEQEFYRDNQRDIDLPVKYKKNEENLLSMLWDGVS